MASPFSLVNPFMLAVAGVSQLSDDTAKSFSEILYSDVLSDRQKFAVFESLPLDNFYVEYSLAILYFDYANKEASDEWKLLHYQMSSHYAALALKKRKSLRLTAILIWSRYESAKHPLVSLYRKPDDLRPDDLRPDDLRRIEELCESAASFSTKEHFDTPDAVNNMIYLESIKEVQKWLAEGSPITKKAEHDRLFVPGTNCEQSTLNEVVMNEYKSCIALQESGGELWLLLRGLINEGSTNAAFSVALSKPDDTVLKWLLSKLSGKEFIPSLTRDVQLKLLKRLVHRDGKAFIPILTQDVQLMVLRRLVHLTRMQGCDKSSVGSGGYQPFFHSLGTSEQVVMDEFQRCSDLQESGGKLWPLLDGLIEEGSTNAAFLVALSQPDDNVLKQLLSKFHGDKEEFIPLLTSDVQLMLLKRLFHPSLSEYKKYLHRSAND